MIWKKTVIKSLWVGLFALVGVLISDMSLMDNWYVPIVVGLLKGFQDFVNHRND